MWNVDLFLLQRLTANNVSNTSSFSSYLFFFLTIILSTFLLTFLPFHPPFHLPSNLASFILVLHLLQTAGLSTAATVVVHSDRAHNLETKPFNADAFEEAIELPIMKYGAAKNLDAAGHVVLYTRKSGFNGVSYVIKNNHTKTLKFTQDCSVGKNIVSHRGTLVYEETITPGEAKVLHHIMPDNNAKGWQSGFSASYDWE